MRKGCFAVLAVLAAAQSFTRADSNPATVPATASRPALPAAGPFLLLAAEETGKLALSPLHHNAFLALAYAQSLAKDLPALRKTAALIEKNEGQFPEKDPRFQKGFESIDAAKLAIAFACAGDMETYRAYLAKALIDPSPRSLAHAYAAGHDYPNMLKALESANPDGLRFQYQDLARQLVSSDPAEAHDLVKKIGPLKPFNGVPSEVALAYGYAAIGDADAALAHAQLAPASPDNSPEIYDSLALEFDRDFNRDGARKVRRQYVAALAKLPPKSQDIWRISLFRCQKALGDQKAAGETMQALVKYAQAYPPAGDYEGKHMQLMAAAEAAAGMGDQEISGQCLKDAAKAIAPSMGDADVIATRALEDSEFVAMWRGQFLAGQGHLDQAVAAITAISDPNRRGEGLHNIILDAINRNDAPAAIAALTAILHPATPTTNPSEKGAYELARLTEIPAVAHLIVESLLQPDHGAAAVDPTKWIQSFSDPEERALAAIAVATNLLAPPPTLPVNPLFP